MKRNLTVQLDDDTIHKARIVAAHRSISVSRLVAQQIEEIARNYDDYEAVRRAALADLERPHDTRIGNHLPTRDEIYDR